MHDAKLLEKTKVAILKLEARIAKNELQIQRLTQQTTELKDSLRNGHEQLSKLSAKNPGLFDHVKGPGRPAGGDAVLRGRDKTFWASVQKLESGCWLWLRGSPLFPHRGCTTAKQVACALVDGKPPIGRLWCVCSTPGCINPDHQEVRS